MELSIIEKTLRPDYYNKQINLKTKYISIPPITYHAWRDTIDSKYLSEWEKFKIQNANKNFSFHNLGSQAIFGIFFYMYALKMLGFKDYKKTKYKFVRIFLGFTFGSMVTMVINSYPYRQKDFYELITQPEPRGSYLRTHLKSQRPRMWSLVSQQLSEQGFNFKEMAEYSENITMPDITTKHDDNLY